MSERAETPSRDLTPHEQARILIVAYWRGVGGDEPHVGYGTAKGHVWLGLAGVVESGLMRLAMLFLFPRLRTQPYGCLVYVPAVVWVGFWALWSWRFAPASGFYALDDAGRPLRFLSKSEPPAILHGRIGTGRKAFVRQASASAR
jgi:hypothetical protein